MYYSTQDTATPARVGAYALGMNIALNTCFLLFLFRYLTNGTPALASSLTAYFDFILLFVIFRKRYGRLGGKSILLSLTKMGWAAVAMAGACFGFLRVAHFDAAQSLLMRAGLLAGMVLVAAAAYFGVAWVLRCEELPEFVLLLRRGGPATASATALEP
jgi:putative peptidoglycan lipid II flippase